MGLFDQLHNRLDKALLEARDESRDEFARIDQEFEDMEKAYGDDYGNAGKERDRYRYKRASLIDPSLSPALGEAGYGLYRPRYSHIGNKTLKEMSLRDPLVAAIIQTRTNQVARFSRPQESRYDPGFKITPIDPSVEIEPGSEEEQEVAFLTDYVVNTGSNVERAPDSKLNFDTWLRLVTRDRLTYGSAAIETIRDHMGRIHSFLPSPTETIYFANKQLPNELVEGTVEANQMAYKQVGENPFEPDEADEFRRRIRDEDDEIEFVQVINGRIHEAFTRQEMIYKLGNPQNFFENNGYCIGELEMATLVITTHLQAENYNKMFFTHGFAARGLLHIKGDVPPSTLQAFRSQWYAQVSGNSNSWRTPVIAGADDVQWIPLSATNRDMEYSVYVDHIIRTLCSIFQISPVEIGFDHLVRETGGLAGEDNETKIEHSQVRGLKPLLVWVESIINHDIFPNIDEELAAKYKFQFVGLDAETKIEEIERQRGELELRSSFNDVRKEVGLDPILGGDVVANPTYIETLMRTHTLGEIREFLFGYKGDSENPKYDYVADPLWFQQRMLIEGPPEGQEIDPETGEPVEEEEEMIDPETGEVIDPETGEPVEEIAEEPAGEMISEEDERVPPTTEKSLEKNLKAGSSTKYHGARSSVVKLDSELMKMRDDYLKNYRSVSSMLMKEVTKTLEEEIDDAISDKSGKS
jgi:hypothetical protein